MYNDRERARCYRRVTVTNEEASYHLKAERRGDRRRNSFRDAIPA